MDPLLHGRAHDGLLSGSNPKSKPLKADREPSPAAGGPGATSSAEKKTKATGSPSGFAGMKKGFFNKAPKKKTAPGARSAERPVAPASRPVSVPEAPASRAEAGAEEEIPFIRPQESAARGTVRNLYARLVFLGVS